MSGKSKIIKSALDALIGEPAPLRRSYPLAVRERWYGDANFEDTGGRIVEMTPEDYLSRVRPLDMDELTRENIDDLKRHIEEGGELDPLAIYPNGKEDGRHRANAAKELGIEQVPVLTWDADEPMRKAGGGLVNKIGKGLIDMLDFTGVGKPRSVKIPDSGEVPALPVEEIDDAAEAYMKKFGIPGSHRIGEYPEFDEEFARRVAGEYDRAKHMPNDPKVRRAYDALLDETMAQYRALEDTGLDVRFLKDGMSDPYARSPSMGYADVVNNGRLWVFPTDQGYGSLDDIGDNPLLKKVGRVGDKKDAVANDAFRVVHDVYGHFGPGNPFFRHQGEDRAWQHHGRMFTDEALPAMTAETRGQNSWLNFGPYGEQNRKALGADTIFADQKATIMPPWVYEKDLGRKPRFEDGGPVWSEDDGDIAAYEDMRDEVSRQSHDIQSMTHLGAKPTRDVRVDMPLLGGEYNFGPAPYDIADSQSGILQTAYDAKTIPLYFTPAAPAAAAWDVAEGIATGDPVQMGMAVAGSIPGKVYKAAYNAAKPYMKPAAATGAMAYALSGDEAEAGLYGRLGKWATSKEGREAMFEAMHLDAAGKKTPGEIMDATGWFKDTDGHWKYFRPSKGGGIIDLRGNKLGKVLDDPNLYNEYPEFADITFRRKNNEGAHFDKDGNNGPEIVLGDISKDGYHSPESGGPWGVTLHETYHAKANKEGWPQGMSVLMGKDKAAKDMIRFLGNRQGTPDFKLGQDMFKLLHSGEGLGFERYQGEVGEALARREQLMREMPPELLRGTTPNNQQYLDMPMSALFHPGEIATPEQYRTLLRHMDDKAAANDMIAAKGDVYFADTPPKKKPAPKTRGR